ncbi:MAG: hypothetical protein HY016_04725 [Nitrosomonadales bacterium]|nr:hypothetical protein [Nitrosomonadales bacterium]
MSDRLRVGYAHQRAGLEPKWYIGAYRNIYPPCCPYCMSYIKAIA